MKLLGILRLTSAMNKYLENNDAQQTSGQRGADITTFIVLQYNLQHPNNYSYSQTERFIGLLTHCTTEKAILTFHHYNI